MRPGRVTYRFRPRRACSSAAAGVSAAPNRPPAVSVVDRRRTAAPPSRWGQIKRRRQLISLRTQCRRQLVRADHDIGSKRLSWAARRQVANPIGQRVSPPDRWSRNRDRDRLLEDGRLSCVARPRRRAARSRTATNVVVASARPEAAVTWLAAGGRHVDREHRVERIRRQDVRRPAALSRRAPIVEQRVNTTAVGSMVTVKGTSKG